MVAAINAHSYILITHLIKSNHVVDKMYLSTW